MNIGPTELLLVLIIFAVPVFAIGVVVVALRARRRPCPACRESVDRRATICPHCRTALAR